MEEYINRKAMLDYIDDCIPRMISKKGKHPIDIENVRNFIAKFEAVDAVPVKHGVWVFKRQTKLRPTGVARTTEEGGAYIVKKHVVVDIPYCSECGERGDDEGDVTPYCPNCGAKMDGGNENE